MVLMHTAKQGAAAFLTHKPWQQLTAAVSGEAVCALEQLWLLYLVLPWYAD